MGRFLDNDYNLEEFTNIDADGMDDDAGGAQTPRASQTPTLQEAARAGAEGAGAGQQAQSQPAAQPQPQQQARAKKDAKEGKGSGANPQTQPSGPTKQAAEHDLEDDAQQKFDNQEAEMEEVEVPAADGLDV